MCGIAGIWDPFDTIGKAAGELRRIASRMTDSMIHRGPDGDGTWSSCGSRLSIGHRRLAIVDLSGTGAQPMLSRNGRWVITFNGEIYNHRELRLELSREGVEFRGASDTEVLLEGISRWGIKETLQRVVGMFAFALWDQSNKTLTLARDRFGEKPLAIYRKKGLLAFASEVRAFRKLPVNTLPINQDAARDVVMYGYIRGNKSIYRDVLKLPPATYLTIRASDLHSEDADFLSNAVSYWQVPDSGTHEIITDSETITQFESLLTRSVRSQMIADVPVGAFLSGGIDSSTIVALAASESGSRLKTFNVGFTISNYDESVWAKKISQHFDTEHHQIMLNEQDLLDAVPTMASVYDEPFADPSQIPSYLVAKFARSQVKVVLTGDGGDEVFCGYNRYTQFAKANRIVELVPQILRSRLGLLLRSLPPNVIDYLWSWWANRGLEIQAPIQSAGSRVAKLASMLETHSVAGRYNALLRTTEYEPVFNFASNDLVAPIPGSSELKQYLMSLDLAGYLPDDNLTKLDRASMATSLEARVPLLDHRIVSSARSLSPEQLVRSGAGKWVLRKILSKHLPAAYFQRPKAGFSVPISAWLRGSLRNWLHDSIRTPDSLGQEILDVDVINRLVEQHDKGAQDHGRVLWGVLMLQNWNKG